MSSVEEGSSGRPDAKSTSSQRRRTQRLSLSNGLIRKRPISFGNPALGTYNGRVYTLEDCKSPPSSNSKPLVEGAQAVERMAAMVDVPPEQVPEGVLNLARSHRQFIVHVRIVIAEDVASIEQQQQQLNHKQFHPTSQGEHIGSSSDLPCTEPNSFEDSDRSSNRKSVPLLSSLSASASAIESAASILAADEELESHRQQEQLQQQRRQQSSKDLSWPIEDNISALQTPSRTYVVLVELCTEEDTANFVNDLHGKPFTILDETVTASVHHVIALQGEDGVSLMSPFFAPSTKKILPSHSSSLDSGTEDASSTNNSNHLTVDHNCAVCLDHMVLDSRTRREDERTSILTTVCNHTFHLDCILRWQDSPCPVCRYDHSGLNEALSQCHLCGTTEHNYVCLICGVVSCAGGASTTGEAWASTSDDTCTGGTINGSSTDDAHEVNLQRRMVSSSHARRHYDETLHAYALDTETQHVWDFAGQGYVHRLLQNKDDGKLVEVNPESTNLERSINPGLSEAQEGEVVHRKLEGFASQYYTLLKSQLEQQRIFYEGRLGEIRREYTGHAKPQKSKTQDLIAALRHERKQLGQRYMSLKRRHEKVIEDVTFLKNMNESLESNKAPLKRKIADAQRQRIEARDMIQMYLPALEAKLTALMLQLEGSGGEQRECAPVASAGKDNDDDRKRSST